MYQCINNCTSNYYRKVSNKFVCVDSCTGDYYTGKDIVNIDNLRCELTCESFDNL